MESNDDMKARLSRLRSEDLRLALKQAHAMKPEVVRIYLQVLNERRSMLGERENAR